MAMKVLMATPYLGSTYGGPAKVVREMTQTLNTVGVTVDLVSTNANGNSQIDVPINTWVTEQNYKVKYFSSWHKNDSIFSPGMTSWLYKNLSNYSLVHTHTIFAPLISLIHYFCQIQKIPYIMTPHGMLEPWALSYKSWKKKYYYNLLETKALAKADVIQTLATSEAEQIDYLGFKNSLVIPNGIHHQEFTTLVNSEIFYQQFPQTRDKTLLLFLGRIDPKKGLDLLAPAFAKAHQQFPNTHLVIAGSDNLKFTPIAQNYFIEVGCSQGVTFTGMLTGSLKYAALNAADIYVAPSYSEGFSMSILEGMASGLPCVITNKCNFSEAATAKAAKIVDVDANSIGEALIDLLTNPLEAKAMGDRARKFIFENYTWEKSAQKLAEVYQNIVKENSQ